MSMHLTGMCFISVYIMGVHLEGVNLVSMYHYNFSYNDPRAPPQVGRNSPTSDTLEANSQIYLWPEFLVESTCPESPRGLMQGPLF
jgi:hypothetical protein